ncbi:MAG: elongation factor P [Thermoanaerobacterales bacterium]|nr:elongation factor P [Bacillota bacterium]MDI6906755.1 elongation factor P [Thermoanaerobacterales bacterium]
MISTNDFRTGLTIELDGEVYQVVDFLHVKPGKGSPFVRSKLRNMRTGAVVERTFNAGEKVPRARLDKREVQYLYNDGENYNFMDTETYEQFALGGDILGDAVKYLKDNMNLFLLFHNGKVLDIELPNTVELTVVETTPGIKGDTASGGSKPATLETGLVVQVPFFVEEGDVLQIDTRTGQYIKRA